MSEENTNTITIDLDKLDFEKPLEEHELINDNICSELVSTVLNTVDANMKEMQANDNDDVVSCVRRPCFFVDGQRGSGKSTLLRAIKTRLLEARDKNSKYIFHELAFIEPSMLADGESFFIHVMSHISKLLKRAAERNSREDKKQQLFCSIRNHMEKMSAGLKLLSSTDECLKNVEDAALFLEDFVDKCSSSTDLRNEFHYLLGDFSELFGCRAFLVTIDDADINFGKCCEILDTVNKYMVTPRIAFIFVGDLSLYQTVVRSRRELPLGKIYLKCKENRKYVYDEVINQLVEQHLLKVFPASHRWHLPSFSVIYKKRMFVQLISDRWEQGKKLADFFEEYIFPVWPLSYKGLIETFFQLLPNRTALQFIKQLSSRVPLAQAKKDTDNMISKRRVAYIDAFMNVFSIPLSDNIKNYEDVKKGVFSSLLQAIIIYVERRGSTPESVRLVPNKVDLSDSVESQYLNLMFAEAVQTPLNGLRCILTLYPSFLVADCAVKFANQSSASGLTKANIDSRHEKITVLTSEYFYSRIWECELGHLGALCTAYLAASRGNFGSKYENRIFSPGIIRLSGIGEKYSSRFDSFKAAYKGIAKKNLTSALAVSYLFCVVRFGERSELYMSIFNFLQVIVRMADSVISYDPRKSKDPLRFVYPFMPDVHFDDISQLQDIICNSPYAVNIAQGLHDVRSHIYREYCMPTKTGLPLKAKYKKVIDDIVEWQGEIKGFDESVFPHSFSRGWESFLDDCAEIDSFNRTRRDVSASTRFLLYMKRFEESFDGGYMGDILQKFIAEFPLWKALKEELSNSESPFGIALNNLVDGVETYPSDSSES